MVAQIDGIPFFLLVLDTKLRARILDLLGKKEYPSVEIAGLDDLLKNLREADTAVILIDSEAVLAFGAGILSKIRIACHEGKMIFLCSQANRDMVIRAMGLGAYGCIIEPYPEWELATMIRPILADMQSKKRTRASKGKPQGRKTPPQ